MPTIEATPETSASWETIAATSLLQPAHLGERDLRPALDDRRDGARVLIGQEALRHDDVEPDRDDDA